MNESFVNLNDTGNQNLIEAKQKINFEKLENGILGAIAKCSIKTLKKNDNNINMIPYYNGKVTRGEYHVLDNGLNIYIYFDENRPVDYRFSLEPLYVEKSFLDRNCVERKTLQYSGATCIEFRNFAFKGVQNDNKSDFHSVYLLCEQNGNLEKQICIQTTYAGGRCLLIDDFSLFYNHPYSTENYEEMKEYSIEADFIGYITNIKQKEYNISKKVGDFKEIIKRINSNLLIKEQKNSQNELLSLLEKYRKINNEFDAFQSGCFYRNR